MLSVRTDPSDHFLSNHPEGIDVCFFGGLGMILEQLGGHVAEGTSSLSACGRVKRHARCNTAESKICYTSSWRYFIID